MIDTMLKLIPPPQLDMEAQTQELLIHQLSPLLNLQLMCQLKMEIYTSLLIFIQLLLYGMNAEAVPSQQQLAMVNKFYLFHHPHQLFTWVFSVAMIKKMTQQLIQNQPMVINITNISMADLFAFKKLITMVTKS